MILDSRGRKIDNAKSYRNIDADYQAYKEFEEELRNRYALVSAEEKKLLYGSLKGDDSDYKTYMRYRSSQLAWSLGAPNLTLMNIHGGGFSGYVEGNTTVETDCQLMCRNIFGAGLGATPYDKTNNDFGTEDFGSIGGNTKVLIKSGNVSNDVFGGGAGVESYKKDDGTMVDFPQMARVKGKTTVDVRGEMIHNETDNYYLERSLVFGGVFGGGDVANVGTVGTEGVIIDNDNKDAQAYATTVNIRGGAVFSQVYAGGNGRVQAVCNDNTQLGAVYGNTRIMVDKANDTYPYNDGSLTAPTEDVIPYIWNRIYGGCRNGKVYGNTLVDIEGGYIGYNIFGGGWGDVSDDGKITSADVTGNTNILVSGGEQKLTSSWLSEQRTWEPTNILGGVTYSPQYDPMTQKF